MTGFKSNKWEESKYWMTICTPTYQRAKALNRVYDSLLNLKNPYDKGKIIQFEWLIVDDGSKDGTKDIVKKWCNEDKIPIRYYYQENQGKHVAVNFAVQHSNSEVFLTLDSDDTLLENALLVFYEEWGKIENKQNYKGLTCRCIDPETKKILGDPLPRNPFDVSTLDLRYKYKIKGEMCGFNRTDLMKLYPFPTPDPRMRFCPESIVWFEMAKKYKERLVDIPVREYYRDTNNAITGHSFNRSISNYYGWIYCVNNVLSYLPIAPKDVIKPCIGASMDGLKIGKGVAGILKDIKSIWGRLLVLTFMPIGYFLSKIR